MLGSSDLELKVSNNKTVEVSNGTLGFHSLAVNPAVVDEQKKLVGLLVDPDTKFPRFKGSKVMEPVTPEYDVRWEKRQFVLAYKERLLSSRAFQG